MTADLVARAKATWENPFATDADPRALLLELADEITHLRAVNESLRREVRTQRQEIAALREERKTLFDADKPPAPRNDNPGAGWIP